MKTDELKRAMICLDAMRDVKETRERVVQKCHEPVAQLVITTDDGLHIGKPVWLTPSDIVDVLYRIETDMHAELQRLGINVGRPP
jgi:hypothetical protein